MPFRVGARLTDARTEYHRQYGEDMTQAELARRAGVTSNTINRIEQGITNPSLVTFRKIVQVLGASATRLLAARLLGLDEDPTISDWCPRRGMECWTRPVPRRG